MNYWQFREQWHEAGCFNIQQVYAWQSGFNRLNLTQWEKKGYIVRLRREYYAFADLLSEPSFAQYLSNRIYKPSYISLHTALAHYGMIPEAVVQITGVTSLKTARFNNAFGTYSYLSVKPALMFGYEPKEAGLRTILFATPEKALLDLLYLHPFYKTAQDMSDLRLDEDFMQDELNLDRLNAYADKVGSKALSKRLQTLLTVYGL